MKDRSKGEEPILSLFYYFREQKYFISSDRLKPRRGLACNTPNMWKDISNVSSFEEKKGVTLKHCLHAEDGLAKDWLIKLVDNDLRVDSELYRDWQGKFSDRSQRIFLPYFLALFSGVIAGLTTNFSQWLTILRCLLLVFHFSQAY